jgi:hypothetical protein
MPQIIKGMVEQIIFILGNNKPIKKSKSMMELKQARPRMDNKVFTFF